MRSVVGPQSIAVAPRLLSSSLGAGPWLIFVTLLVAVGTVASPRPPRPPLPTRASEAASQPATLRGDLLLVLGAAGTDEFGTLFGEWASLWRQSADNAHLRIETIGQLTGDPSSSAAKTSLQQALRNASTETQVPLWIVMLGHGTFDGRDAKFNLVGEDVTAEELAAWLAPLKRPVAVLQCASSSAPFLETLSAPNRVVVTATKSGQEINFARFGGFLAAAFSDPSADLDKDDQVSLLEAFLRAARQTEEFYTGDNRLATEHPLLDDNADARGTRAAAFAGVRPVREASSGATLDGYLAHQWVLHPSLDELRLSPERRLRRDELERRLVELRDRKKDLDEEAYYRELEVVLVELTRVSLARDDPQQAENLQPE